MPVVVAGGPNQSVDADQQIIDRLQRNLPEKIGEIIRADRHGRHPAERSIRIIDAAADVEDGLTGHSSDDRGADEQFAGIAVDMGLKVGAIGDIDRCAPQRETEKMVAVDVDQGGLVGEAGKAGRGQDRPDLRRNRLLFFEGLIHQQQDLVAILQQGQGMRFHSLQDIGVQLPRSFDFAFIVLADQVEGGKPGQYSQNQPDRHDPGIHVRIRPSELLGEFLPPG